LAGCGALGTGQFFIAEIDMYFFGVNCKSTEATSQRVPIRRMRR
jgi:hypothetical protein